MNSAANAFTIEGVRIA